MILTILMIKGDESIEYDDINLNRNKWCIDEVVRCSGKHTY